MKHHPSSSDHFEELAGMRSRLLERLLFIFGLALLPGIALSVSRSAYTGWLLMYSVQIGLIAGVWLLFVLRSRLSYGSLAGLFLGLTWAVALLGIVQLGPVADGKMFLVVASFVSVLLLPLWIATQIIAGIALSLAGVGVAATQGWLVFRLDYAVYAAHPLSWAVSLYSLLAYGGMVAYLTWEMLNRLYLNMREAKQANATLRESEQRFRDIFEHSPIAYQSLDSRGRFLEANPALCELLGYRAEELIGKSFGELWSPATQEQFPRVFECFSQNGHTQGDLELVRGDGRIITILLQGRIQRDSHGVFARTHCMLIDISARKQAERQQMLNEQRLASLLALSSDAPRMSEDELYRAGLEDAERLSNSAISYLHFISEDQETIQIGFWSQATLAQCEAAFDSHYPVSQAGLWADSVRQQCPLIHNEYQNLSKRKGCPQGHAHLLRHMNVPVVEDGKVRLILGVGNKAAPYDEIDLRQLQLHVKDLWGIITRRRTEIALDQARLAAEAANRAKSAFLANMSHEFRTPLNAILGFAQILAGDSSLSAAQQHSVQSVQRGGEHLLTLISDILDLAKIEADRFEISDEECDLLFILDDIEQMFRVRAQQRQLHFEYQVQTPLPRRVRGDSKWLRQILINLLGNAMKFTERGSVTLRVGFDNGELRMEVEDTGLGIAPEDQEKIFEPFSQAGDPQYKAQGTGLGLTITRKLAQLMGGGLRLHSELGRGSRFSVALPLPALAWPDAAPAWPTAVARRVASYRRTQGQGALRVLITDDISDNREVLLGMLQPLGFAAQEAGSGKECLRLAPIWQPDAILMDLRMPGLDGLQTTIELRKQLQFADIPIIAVSACAYDEDRIASRQAGCTAHIGKPVKREELLQVLQAHLPLQWEFQETPPPPAAGPPLGEEQQAILLKLLRGGEISAVMNYLEELSRQPGCPASIPELLRLAQNFEIELLRRQLEKLGSV